MTIEITQQRQSLLNRQNLNESQQIAKLNKALKSSKIRSHTNFKSKSIIQADQVQGWVPKNKSINIAGRIVEGMVYIGTPPNVKTIEGKYQSCVAYLDPSLPITFGSTSSSFDEGYLYATYSALKPVERGKYLNWLELGKSYSSCDPRFIFIYFLSLERRLLVDNPSPKEVIEIIAEIKRLKKVFSHVRPKINLEYIEEFEDYYQLTTDATLYLEKAYESTIVMDPIVHRINGSLRIIDDIPLSYEQYYGLLLLCNDSMIDYSCQKYPYEFELRFMKEFEYRFPAGFKFPVTRKYLHMDYQSVSGEFSCNKNLKYKGDYLPTYFEEKFFDEVIYPLGIKIANELIEAKEPTRKSSKKRNPLNSREENHTQSNSVYDKIKRRVALNWKNKLLKEKKEVTIYDVLKFTVTSDPINSFIKADWDRAVEKLYSLGFGLIPDQTLYLDYHNVKDPVLLVELDDDNNNWRETSVTYYSVLVSVALGFLIFQNNGSLTKAQRSLIEEILNKTNGLSPTERMRLTYNYQRMLIVPPYQKFVSRIRRNKKEIDPNIARSILTKCASQGYLNNAGTVSLMESVYNRLGIDPALVYSDLHSEEITAHTSKSHSIKSKSRELDIEKINKIRTETEQVSSTLGEIFSEKQETFAEESNNLERNINGLDLKHELLVRDLIEKSSWSESEFVKIAKQQGLFPDGALETINEWAFEKFDSPLIDNHDGYQIESNIVEKLATLV